MKTFKITYNYAAPNGALRSGAYVIEAKDVTDATKQAEAKLSEQHKHFRITGCKTY